MVYLEPDELEALKTRARAERVSLAGLVRRLVRDYLARHDVAPAVPAEAYARLVALGSSGHRDISQRHDAYLGDAVKRDHAR